MNRILLVNLSVVILSIACMFSCNTSNDSSKALVQLKVDNTSLIADGTSHSNFMVFYSSTGDMADLVNITDNSEVEILQEGVGKIPNKFFATDLPGTYKFVAQYKGVRSQPVSIIAELEGSVFARNRVVFCLTSTGCRLCPIGSAEVNAGVLVYPNKLFPLYFHSEMSPPADPFVTISTQWFSQWMGTSSLPSFNIDNRYRLYNGEFSSSVFDSYFVQDSDISKSHSGFSVSSEFDQKSRKMWCRVALRMTEPRYQYDKVHLVGWITEDKIIAPQAMPPGNISGDYVHNFVVRKGLYGTGYSGRILDPMYLGSGLEYSDTIEMVLPENWNVDNSNLTFYLYHDRGGDRLKDTLINSISIPIGGSQNYQIID